MSKRGADSQRMGDTEEFISTGPQMEGNNKATAAQMANRRINRARGGRRPGIQPRPSAVISSPSGAQQGSTPLSFTFNNPIETNGTQESQGGFVFGQPSNGVSHTFNQPPSINTPSVSQSFPPFGANSQNTFHPQLPTSTFNFNAGPNNINNPFSSSIDSSSGSKPSGMGCSNGFQGNIFNIPPTGAYGSDNFHLNGNNSTVNSDPFKFGSSGESTNAPLQLAGNTFNSSAKSLFAPNNTSLVSQKQMQPTTNIFGQLKSPTKFFGQKPVPSEQTHSQQPISNMFGRQTTEQDSTSSIIFRSNKPLAQQTNAFAIQNEDTMSTSPDNSPQPKDRTSSTPSTFPNAPSQANEGDVSSTQNLGGNLFNRTSQPAAEIATSLAASPAAEQEISLKERLDLLPHQDPNFSTASQSSVFGFSQPPPRQELRAPEASPTRGSRRTANPSFGTPPLEEAQAVASNHLGNIEISPNPPITQVAAQRTPSASSPADTRHTSDGAGYMAQGQDSSPGVTTQPSLESNAQIPRYIDHYLSIIPPAPEYFTDDQCRKMVIGWQLRCLDSGYNAHMATSNLPYAEHERLNKFHARAVQDILDGKYVFVKPPLAGTKRKPVYNQHEDEVQSKKAKFENSPSTYATQQGHATNGGLFTTNSSAKPLLTEPAPVQDIMNAKRKAEESLVRNNVEGAADGVKRARVEDKVSYPSLSSSPSSQTSNIFKNILNNNREPDPSPSPTEINRSTAETSGGQKPTRSSSEGNLPNPQDLSSSSSGPTNGAFYGSKPAPTLSQPTSSTSENSVLLLDQQNISNPPFVMDKPASFAPPKFGAPMNFLSQFGQAAEATAKKEKASRKADDFDSDEDDEAEWERKYTEEKRAKKQKLDEEVKGSTTRFVPGQGFSFSSEDANTENPNHSPSSEPPPPPSLVSTQNDFGTSILSKPPQKLVNGHNIFGHLSDAESGAEGSKTGDADDEDTGSEEDDVRGDSGEAVNDSNTNEATFHSKIPSKNNPFRLDLSPVKETKEKSVVETAESQSAGGLFDRISKDANGNPMREIPSPAQQETDAIFNATSSQTTINIFGQGNQAGVDHTFGKSSSSALSGSSFGPSSPFNGLPKSSAPAEASPFRQTSSVVSQAVMSGTSNNPTSNSVRGDNTWKVDSPIKFGNSGKSPELKITSPSPSKPALGGLFGSPQTNNLMESSMKPASALFSTTPTKDPSVSFGFGFGGPPKPGTGSLAPPSNIASNNTSRTTSPGATTGGESANEDANAEEGTDKHEQLDLTARGPGEEDEDVLFAVKAKAMSYDSATKTWPSKGVGVLRVLKHRETDKTRILMRQDPSGKIVLNAALLGTMKYEYVQSKTVKIAVATDQGKLSPWMLRTGKDEDAVELARIFEAEKSS
ncbi:hypothetical protein MMC07_003069 [Pseudocyphellaria aurata]|nr:hypothetical protein [Pseudocyphellaria aurata]